MPNKPNESPTAAKPELDDAMVLDKETLKDLEAPLTDGEAVKGGAWPSMLTCTCYTCFVCPVTKIG